MKFFNGNTSYWYVSQEKIDSVIKSLWNKRDNLGFIDIDTNIDLDAIHQYVKNTKDDFDNIVVLWIWWSALWTKALLESLYGKYYNEIKDKAGKNIYVLDNIDPDSFIDIEKIIDIKKTLFIFISKSGGTIETLSEYLYFREQVQENISDWKKHFCFIVWEKCSMKDELEKDFQVFYIPENIGGRFSVFTPVWLLPLCFAGADISKFISAISENKSRYVSNDIDENIALKLALTQYYYYNSGKNITVFFPYTSRLFQTGEWCKQLLWESIWKDGKWITLTSSLGVTDQHSQLQLFQDGPQDKLFITLWIEKYQDVWIDTSISKFSFWKLLKIEKYGTTTSLQNEGIPVCDIELSDLDETAIADLLYMFMFQTAYLGELFKINAFDQPGVEKSKIITREKLQEEFPDIDIFNKAFYD